MADSNEEIPVRIYFKEPGDDVRLLIVHSTADDLGHKTAEALRGFLAPAVVVVGVERCADFRGLLRIVAAAKPFNVLLVIAHGNATSNRVRLFGDVDAAGNVLRVSVGELKAALEGHADDILALFGVCHFGTDDLAEAMVEQAGALACVAPKPEHTITDRDIISGFGTLLNAMQAGKKMGIGPHELTGFVRDSVPKEMFQRLSIRPVV
jgi:hypothetical protein